MTRCAVFGAIAMTIAAAAIAESEMRMNETGTLDLEGSWQDEKNFSAVAFAGPLVFVGSDETSFIQVGKRRDEEDTYRAGQKINLGDEEEEIDIEGLELSGSTLYAVGSHSATRARADDESRDYQKNLERLRRVETHPEREHLFRIDLDLATGRPTREPESISLRPLIEADAVLAPFVGNRGADDVRQQDLCGLSRAGIASQSRPDRGARI
jgi:hypothetical protein